MSLLVSFVPFLFVFLHSSPCYYSLPENRPCNYLDETSGHEPPRWNALRRQWKRPGEVWRGYLASAKIVNVNDYGAKGDGSDATQAFKKAWEAACSSAGSVLMVPKNNIYLLKPITFTGPCKAGIKVQVYGTVRASTDPSAYRNDMNHWLVFRNIHGLTVQGGGIINGKGETWWENSCKVNKNLPCKNAPTALTFYNCKNLVVKNLRLQNAQQMHVSFEQCNGVRASGISVTAPKDSPNTDGIHVVDSQNIYISNSVVRTGDDCVSIVSGSQNVQVTDIICGPGHGISIGSLGAQNSEAHVSNIIVNRATLSETTNGVRIKTWQGGSGSAENIKFENIKMYNVENPIIINQKYCDQEEPCKAQNQAVQVRNVLYKNIVGTSSSTEAIKLDCSAKFPCQGITLQEIDIQLEENVAEAMCNHARVTEEGNVSPSCT